MSAATDRFAVRYAPELAQYVVERGAADALMRVVPTTTRDVDPVACVRAWRVCVALNRVYGADAPQRGNGQ